jgi:hypothetical protein
MDFRTRGLPVYGNLKGFTRSTLGKRLIPIAVINGRQNALWQDASDALSPGRGLVRNTDSGRREHILRDLPRPEYKSPDLRFWNLDRVLQGGQ